MKWVRPSAILFVFAVFFAACGNGNVVLSIDPVDVIVKRGLTQKFTANEDQVTWSVDGGSSNGAVDQNGLYTAPNVLPVNPVVTVRTAKGLETATATVHLVVSDALVFSEDPSLVSQDPDHRMDDEGLVAPGAVDRLAIAQGGARVDVTWGADEIFFNQQLNSAGFGVDRTLTNTADTELALGVEEDVDDNPVLLFNSGAFSNGRVQVMTSPNGVASFGNPVTVFPALPGDFQFQASLAVDEQNIFHVVLENGPNSGVGFSPIDGTLYYSKSTDGGATWPENPLPIVTPEGPDDVILFSHLQVDPEGIIYVCYSVDPDGGVGNETADLFLAKSADDGASFSITNLTPGSATDNTFCHLSLGPDGEIYLSYHSRLDDNETDVLFRRSLDGGETFSSPIMVNSDTAGFQGFAFISTDIAGRIAAVWASDRGQQDQSLDAMMYSQSLDGGKTFSPNLEIADGLPAFFRLPMGLRHDQAGRVHVLFASTDDELTGADIYYLKGE